MSTPRGRRFSEIEIGEALPELEVEVDLTSLVMYAAATWDFHRYHYDPAYVAERGLRAPFMDGQMVGALFARQLMHWGGPDAFVRRLSYRLRAMVFVGEKIRLSGKVSAKTIESGRELALCGLDIVKPDGTSVVEKATAAVEFGGTMDHCALDDKDKLGTDTTLPSPAARGARG